MRNKPGRHITANGHELYVEESGHGQRHVVFEGGLWSSRTCWDRVLPLLVAEDTRLITYDRIGLGRSAPLDRTLTVEQHAADLVALIEHMVPDRLVLVAHSYGGVIARLAAPALRERLDGMLLLDPFPERAHAYDDIDAILRMADRPLAMAQWLTRVRPLRPVVAATMKSLPPDTFRTILDEDATPRGVKQARREWAALADSVPRLRQTPPEPPHCPVVLLSADQVTTTIAPHHADLQAAQRAYIDSLPNGHFETVDCTHHVEALAPEVVAERVRTLLRISSGPAQPPVGTIR
ncbi:alpha/beta fold hydrolase [Nocardia cyriacigeorgica]|uniref:Alpha/beta hydrolase n=1 Tax=Nocardia cyriacigeorgica TaxID=135487 RepID=A0A6P1DAT8_9NOCA|nr:alpha/beta hydrolase [Nocardia cyriacigeorgica]NEW46729.1 alpha/beta hydrolase [Nocardia cyriacigeorgica]